MKKNLSIFTILALVITIASCSKKIDQIGLEVQPTNESLGVHFSDTTTINAHSVLVDSVLTGGSSVQLMGSMMDPVFGLTDATIYTQVRLTGTGVRFEDTDVFDSLVLTMAYYDYYGDTLTQQNLKVYELTEAMDSDTTAYYHMMTVPHTNVALADLDYYPTPRTLTVDIDTVEGDTTYAAQYFRINLSDISPELGERIMNADTNVFADNEAWLDFFKGLAIVPTSVSSGGSLVYWNLLSGGSNMNLYYSNEDGESEIYQFTINENCARFTNFNHNDYLDASAAFRAQVIDGDTTFGKEGLYIQPTGGVKTIIDFPYIDSWNNLGAVAINDAKLLITGVDLDPDSLYGSPSRLFLERQNEDGNWEFMPDFINEDEEFFGGTYNASANTYEFRISRHIQQLLNSTHGNYPLRMTVTGGAIHAKRVVYYGTAPTVEYDKRLKLKLVYSVVD